MVKNMNKLNLEIPHGVTQYLSVLQDALSPNFRVVLAGGFLRDSSKGVKPKDLDILVAPIDNIVMGVYDDGVAIVDNVVQRVADAHIPDWFFGNRVLNCDYIEDMKKRGLVGLIMGECPNLDNMESQLIIYGKPMNPTQMAHDMDMNINQVVMLPDGTVWATDAFVYGMNYGLIKVLQDYSEERQNQRIGRMLSKYPTFKVV